MRNKTWHKKRLSQNDTYFIANVFVPGIPKVGCYKRVLYWLYENTARLFIKSSKFCILSISVTWSHCVSMKPQLHTSVYTHKHTFYRPLHLFFRFLKRSETWWLLQYTMKHHIAKNYPFLKYNLKSLIVGL